VIAIGDGSLVVISWKTPTVLAGTLAAISIGLVALAIASGPGHAVGQYALPGAGIALFIGATLHGIGHVIQRLLDEEPSDSRR
jgi:hypothetical protein